MNQSPSLKFGQYTQLVDSSKRGLVKSGSEAGAEPPSLGQDGVVLGILLTFVGEIPQSALA